MNKTQEHEVYIFEKTNYSSHVPIENQIKVGKPYMLIKKKNRIIKLDEKNGTEIEKNSYFYALNEDYSVNRSKIYKVLTNWWHTEASYKNARIIGTIKSVVQFEEVVFAKDF